MLKFIFFAIFKTFLQLLTANSRKHLPLCLSQFQVSCSDHAKWYSQLHNPGIIHPWRLNDGSTISSTLLASSRTKSVQTFFQVNFSWHQNDPRDILARLMSTLCFSVTTVRESCWTNLLTKIAIGVTIDIIGQ